MNSRDGRLRSPRSVVLLLAALATALAVVAGMLWLRDRGSDGVPLQGEPMTDAQAAGQVVASAKQIVGTAQLHDAAGGYAFVSCKNEHEPPYQVAIYMTFRLPQDNSVKYLRDIGASMVAHGWTPAGSMGEHFGQKLTGTASRRSSIAAYNMGFATMRLYGECRNTADHRNDNPVWTEVTDQLG